MPRGLRSLGAALFALAVLSTGCSSAKITDAYMSRDTEGIRQTACFRPEWADMYAIVELLSFKEDTLLTPVMYSPFYTDPNPRIRLGLVDQELERYRSIAPGTGDLKLALPFQAYTVLEFCNTPSAIDSTTMMSVPSTECPSDTQYCNKDLFCSACLTDVDCAIGERCDQAAGQCLAEGATLPFPMGRYILDLYLDSEFITGPPDESLVFEVGSNCPCRPVSDCAANPPL